MPWLTHPPLTSRQIAEFRSVPRRRTKFLVDENLGPQVTRLVRQSGWNAKGTEDLGLNGHCDRDVFAAARRHGRVLLTQDHDFLDDRRFPPRLNPGLVVLPGAEGNRKLVVSVLDRVLRIVGADRDLWSSTKIIAADDSMWFVRAYEQDSAIVVETRYRILRHGIEVWSDHA